MRLIIILSTWILSHSYFVSGFPINVTNTDLLNEHHSENATNNYISSGILDDLNPGDIPNRVDVPDPFQGVMGEPVKLKTLKELNHRKYFNPRKRNVVYHILDSNTIVRMDPESADQDDTKFWSEYPVLYEYSLDDEFFEDYHPRMPVSECHSEIHGDGGSVGIGYSISISGGFSQDYGLSLAAPGWLLDNFLSYLFISKAKIGRKVGYSIEKKLTVASSLSCNVGKGHVGQVLADATYVMAKSPSRRPLTYSTLSGMEVGEYEVVSEFVRFATDQFSPSCYTASTMLEGCQQPISSIGDLM